jgi:predicted component of type VI protein secretion system
MIEHNEQTLVENLWDDSETSKMTKRQRTTKSIGDEFVVYLVDDTPRTNEEAYLSLDADYWKEAIKNEMDSIMSNRTWVQVGVQEKA